MPARGTFTGNRGIIHDPKTRTLLRRRWTSHAWITCALEFRGYRRTVMSPGSWTELFFLDEVTALAAGHRPCYLCRRQAALSFARSLSASAGVDGLRAPDIDRMLHAQRWASAGVSRVPIGAKLIELPDGAVVMSGDVPYALRGAFAFPWAPSGYGPPTARETLLGGDVALITPPLTCQALHAGYDPVWHVSA